jgi:hypothetical protein
MAKTWDSFFPYVQPHVPGCPEIVIQSHLQEAAAEYTARSGIWRFDIEPDYTSKSASDYEIDVPTGAVLENILTLYVDGVPSSRVSDRHFSRSSTAGNAAPTFYSIYQDNQIRFYPTPADKHMFSGVGILKTSLTASGVEDFIFESHGRSIACGAIWKLAAIPNKEWSDTELSMYYRNLFYRHIEDAKGRDTRRANLRVNNVGFERATVRGGV